MQSAHIKGMILTAVAGITFRTVDLAPSNVNEGLAFVGLLLIILGLQWVLCTEIKSPWLREKKNGH